MSLRSAGLFTLALAACSAPTADPSSVSVQANALAIIPASIIRYDNDASGLAANNVQRALDVLAARAAVPGPRGAPGPQGVAGPSGAMGPQGIAGPQGVPGVKGDAGAPGPRGEAGAQGERGEVGPAGQPGLDGETGPAGATGPRGEVGERGERGATGADGERGPAGERGAAGAVGPAGPEGATGPAGVAGANGIDGKDGKDGINGARGDIGPAGPAGERGPVGPPGESGGAMAWQLDEGGEVVLAVANQGIIANAVGRVDIELPALEDLHVGDTFTVTGAEIGGWAVYPADDTRIRARALPGPGRWFEAAPQVSNLSEYRRWISVSPDGSTVAETQVSRTRGKTWFSPSGANVDTPTRRTFAADGRRVMGQQSAYVAMWTSAEIGAAEAAVVLLSTDGAATFVAQNLPIDSTAALARDGLHIVAVAVGRVAGNLTVRSVRSEDFGATWRSIRTSTLGPTQFTAAARDQGWPVISPDGRRVYVCLNQASLGLLLVSSDFGDTFQAIAAPGITQLRLSGDGTRLFKRVDTPTDRGVWHRSTDHGVTWTQISPAGSGVFDASSDLASSYDGQTLAIAGGTGVLLSRDGGSTWAAISNPPRAYNATPTPGDQRIERVALSDDGDYLVGSGSLGVGGRWSNWVFTYPLIGSDSGLAGNLGESLTLVYVGGGNFNILSSSGSLTPQ